MNRIIRRLAGLAIGGVTVAVAALVLVSTGLVPFGTSSETEAGQTGRGSTDARVSTVARATGESLDVFRQPRGPRLRRLANPLPSGSPLVLLVVAEQPEWLQVQLAERPNGSTGWVRRQDVTIDRHEFRVEVSLSRHRLSAFDGDRLILSTAAAVGQPQAPTPAGRFYTTEVVRPADPTGPYGPYAFGLSAHSEVLDDFAGGDGTVGIHGTNDPGALGTDASHGCIRVSNEAITALAEVLPAGTPVLIVR